MGLSKNDSCIFVTLDDSRKDKLLIFVDIKEQGGFLSGSVESTIYPAQRRCSSDCPSRPASGSQGAENIFRATMATVVGAQGRTFF